MRPFTSTISLDEARQRLATAIRPIVRTERVAIEQSAGRVAAADVVSPMDVPPFARSAMDGYAVIASDTASATRTAPALLRIADWIYTGHMPHATISRGTCAEIATGAPIPEGADAVVMVEETTRDQDGPPEGGPHVQKQGQPHVPEQGQPHVSEQGRPHVPEQVRPRVQELGRPRGQEQGRSRRQEHGRPHAQESGGPHVQEQGGPHAKEQGGYRVEETVAILNAAIPGQNIGRRGADIVAGAVVVSAGDVLTPGRVGSLAAIGMVDVEVFERPRVAVLSTGNEVISPGRPLAPGQIYDVNRFTLSAIIAAHGGLPEPRHIVHDSIDALMHALDQCRGADLLVFSGGSSVGERDLIVDIVEARGEMIFHGISIKPGKPTAFALVDGMPFFGMPGNPTSCLSNAYILLVPYLRAMARLPAFHPRSVRVPLGRRIESSVARHQIYTVRITEGIAYPAFKGSGDITSLSQADGYIEIAEGESFVDEGTPVDVTLF